MKYKKILLTALLPACFSLPAIASKFDSNSGTETNIQQHDIVEAENSSSTKSESRCWVYVPGLGWIYIC